MAEPILFRCHSIGRLMTEPKAKSEVLSVGAKTHVRELVAQDVLGIDFEIGGKPIEKGLECEDEAIGLLNRVRGLALVKNAERRRDGHLSGECDLFDALNAAGYDLKCAWSAATFPIIEMDCVDRLYEWQCRGYMRLWNARRWTVAYALVNTPERLIGFEPAAMHFFDHIPEELRLTTWTVERDLGLEAEMVAKMEHARRYFIDVAHEFERTHTTARDAAVKARVLERAPALAAALPSSIF